MEGTSKKRSRSQKHYSSTFKTPILKGHPISTEILNLMPSNSAQCCSSSSPHSLTRKNLRRQTLLSRPRTHSSKEEESEEESEVEEVRLLEMCMNRLNELHKKHEMEVETYVNATSLFMYSAHYRRTFLMIVEELQFGWLKKKNLKKKNNL